jgi:hypothetical protein
LKLKKELIKKKIETTKYKRNLIGELKISKKFWKKAKTMILNLKVMTLK